MDFLPIAFSCFFLFSIAESISPTGYSNKALLSFNIGRMPNTPEVHLENFSGMTATVRLYINETSTEIRDENIIVHAPKNYGIMAFVKTVHLRYLWTTPKPSNTTFEQVQPFRECKDYLMFKTSVNSEIQKICREAIPSDLSLAPKGLIGPRIFHEPNERINISIHLGPYVNPKSNLAEIIFTAFFDCWSVREDKRRCSGSYPSSCIPSNLVCDGKIHCAFPDGFGTDEMGCIEDSSSEPIEETENVEIFENHDERDNRLRNYLIPTSVILFMIWGIITMIRKCYKCYKDDKEKEEMYY